MLSCFLQYKSSLIHYEKKGSGKRMLLGFHGYGSSSGSFALLGDYIADGFTLIAIDLPFHGKTDWREGLTFTVTDLIKIIEQIARDAVPDNSKIYLLGFSMGGRIALSVLQSMPDKIERIILLAPDGLKINAWYRLATANRFGNAFFKFTMKHPGWLLLLLNISQKLKIANQSVHKFVISHVHDEQSRNDLYARWTTLREFKNDPEKIKPLIILHKIAAKLVYGEMDRIVTVDGGKKFIKGIEPYCEILVLPCGHQILQDKNVDSIIRLLRE